MPEGELGSYSDPYAADKQSILDNLPLHIKIQMEPRLIQQEWSHKVTMVSFLGEAGGIAVVWKKILSGVIERVKYDGNTPTAFLTTENPRDLGIPLVPYGRIHCTVEYSGEDAEGVRKVVLKELPQWGRGTQITYRPPSDGMPIIEEAITTLKVVLDCDQQLHNWHPEAVTQGAIAQYLSTALAHEENEDG